MGSRLLNGSPQFSVRVTMLWLILFSTTVTPGTIVGTPKNMDHCLIKHTVYYYVHTYVSMYYNYASKYSHNIMEISRLQH